MSQPSLADDRHCDRLPTHPSDPLPCRRSCNYGLGALPHSLLVAALLIAPLAVQPAVAGIGYGNVWNDPNPYLWISQLVNDPQSTSNVARIELDSSTSAYTTAWNWGLAVDWLDGSNEFDFLVSGLDTPVLGLDFTYGGLDSTLWPGIAPGDFWLIRLSPNIQAGTPVEAMIGVTARFFFVDGSQWAGRFVDQPPEVGNPFPNGRYTLQQIEADVPEPGSLGILALGIVGLAGHRLCKRPGRQLRPHIPGVARHGRSLEDHIAGRLR